MVDFLESRVNMLHFMPLEKGLMDRKCEIFKYTEIVTDEILIWKEERRGS